MVFVGGVGEGVDAVVDVFLNGVVDRALAAARPRAVVVDAKSASAIDEVDVVAHVVEVDVVLCGFAQGGLNAAYFRDLAADMEVDEVQAVAHAQLVELLQGLEEFRRGESELAGVSSALFPFARSRRGELDADAEVGLHGEASRGLGDEIDLVEFLHDDEDTLAHLLGQQGQFDVAGVLVAVADDKRVALALHGDDGVELGLRPCLKSEVELASVADDLLHHGLHLVHLDGIDDEVLAFVAVFLPGLLKAA